jgi:hypothetical protein
MATFSNPIKEQLSYENIAFPFNLGEGYEIILLKIGYKSNFDLQNKEIKIIYNEFFEVNNQVKIDKILIRADNIRKKIKSGFHKCLLKIINDFIKSYCPDKKRKHFFVNLPQNFIANVNKENNHDVMELTLEKLILMWKNEKNENLIDYLNNNPELSEKSKWNIIKNMTYKQLLEAYFLSAEFEKSICELQAKSELKNKKVGPLYIETYINIALTYIDFYTSPIIPKKDNYFPYNTSSIFMPLNYCEYEYISGINLDTPIHMNEENPIITINESSFGFSTIQSEDDIVIINKEENDSSNEKMSCSDDNEAMNESFDEQKEQKSFGKLFDEQNKKFS